MLQVSITCSRVIFHTCEVSLLVIKVMSAVMLSVFQFLLKQLGKLLSCNCLRAEN
jgi:hypothetical protein